MKFLKHIALFAVGLMFVSCRVSNKIPEEKHLYGGADIHIVDSLRQGRVPELKTKLEEAVRPHPNTMVFGWPYKVGFNFLIGEKKKDSGFKEWFRKRLGEEPVYIDNLSINQNLNNLTAFLQSYGYFDAEVSGELKRKKDLGYADYTVNLNQRYAIDSVIVEKPAEGGFYEDFGRFSGSFEFPDYFDLEAIKFSRQKMYNQMQNEGYYHFKPEHISILMDSTQNKYRLTAKIEPEDKIPVEAKRQYQINNIFVNIDSPTRIDSEFEGTSMFNLFRGLVMEDENLSFKERIFLDAIAFRPGQIYNNTAAELTNNRLLGLNNFKFIQSRMNVVNLLDSTLVDVYYNLQTIKRQTLHFETSAISRSSGLAGTQLSLSWLNRNTFKGAEQLKIGINGNFEFQLGGNKTQTQYNENYRTGAEVALSFPRFVAPFIKINPEESKVLPKTQLRLTYENFIKRGLYDLNSASANWGYAWTRGRGIEHAFWPLTFNFVKSSNLSTAFIDEIFYNPNLISILDNQFILGSGYELYYTPRQYKKGLFTYRGGVDIAGTLLTLYDKWFEKNEENRGFFFDERYSQFVRLDNEIRYRYDFTRNFSWANRAILSVGIPYGDQFQLPFVRQFFVGGNNSLRGFRAREVGPGSYRNVEASSIEKFLGNNTGDIKIEFNTEVRIKATDFISLAAFIDAGNVWLYKDPYIYDERAVFHKNFLNDMAVSGGVGFRFDFSFVIFRVDVGMPMRKPWLEDKWVLYQIKLGQKDWRSENLIWNFAVGLPF